MNLKDKSKIFIKIFYISVMIFLIYQNVWFFIFIGIHEIAHLVCGIYLGYSLKKITLLPFGFSLCFKEVFIKPRDNIIISLFGPFTNLIFFVIFCMLGSFYSYDLLESLKYINLTLFIFNLMPVGFLDGGRVLKELLSMYVGFSKSNITINLNGIIFGCIILILNVFTGNALNKIVLCLIGFSLIINSIIQMKWIKLNIIQEVLYKRFKKDNKYTVYKDKFYSEDNKVFDIIKNFRFNISYNIKVKENNDMCISENELINIYFTRGNLVLRDCFS